MQNIKTYNICDFNILNFFICKLKYCILFGIKAALAFFYCAYYPRIFSWMFCGEITTNRRQLYRFRVFKIAELETVRPDVSGVNLRSKKNNSWPNSFRNNISYNNASAAEMIGPEMSVSDILTLRNVYIDRINNVNVKN